MVLRIGLVCEGRTDIIAFKAFLGAALRECDIEASFVELQPDADRTRSNPHGGWGNVESWLRTNPPAARIERHTGVGLFAGGLDDHRRCDVFVIQIDGDNLDDAAFLAYNMQHYVISDAPRETPTERFDAIETLLHCWSGLDEDEIVDADRHRHILAPAVENTETWMLAAFCEQSGDVEAIRIGDQPQPFGEMLARLENRSDEGPFTSVNKDIARRERLCRALSNGRCVPRLVRQSASFRSVYERCQRAAG